MTLPIADKTWQFNINQLIPASGIRSNDDRLILLTIKNSLTTFASNPWTVTGSCDRLAGGMDAVDRWGIYLQGTDINANVNTTTNNTIRIRKNPVNTYSPFTLTAPNIGAAVAKTAIRDDLNIQFTAAGLTLLASITGTNQLTIADSNTTNVYIEIDTVANGSTLNTPLGFVAATPAYQTPTHCTINKVTQNSAGSAHSWIVLKQASIFSTFELCIDCSNSTSYYISVIVGLSGFTGGSTTARPTAVTQSIIINNSYYLDNSGSTQSYVIQAMQSTDGYCTRMVFGYNINPVAFWLFDVPKNPVSGWTNPAIWFAKTPGSTSSMTLNSFVTVACIGFYAASTFGAGYLTCEGVVNSSVPEWAPWQQPNQISGEQQIYPIGMASETASVKGRHCQIFDMYFGNIAYQSIGAFSNATYPNDTTRLWWQSDDIILPWSGLNGGSPPIPIMRY